MSFHPRFLIIPILLALCSVVHADDVSATTLPNGMKIIVREGHSINLVAVDIWVKAGSVNETADKNGVSHFVEHMIFKSTKRFGPGQIDREIEGLGAELNGGTSKDYTHFYTTVASEYLPNALDVIADAVVYPQFRAEDMEKERLVLQDEIARAESNRSQQAFNLFAQTAFTVHPYRLPSTGSKDSLAKLTRDDLVAYYNKYYTPSNICVVIVGDVKLAEAVSAVEKAFSGFTKSAERGVRSAEFPSPPVEPAMTSARVKRFKSDADKAYVVLGYRVPGASDLKQTCTLDVMFELLGDTYRGRIASALTAAGVQFGAITPDFVTQRYPTTFSILVTVDPKDVDKLTPLLVSEFHKLATEDVSDGELNLARRLVEGSDLYDQETFSGQARALGTYEMAGTYDMALKYGPTVRTVTAADIKLAAAKYFTSDNCCEVILSREDAK